MITKSNHAIARQQQRGIPNNIVETVLEYGLTLNKREGAIGYTITRSMANQLTNKLKHAISTIERASGIIVVQSSDDTTITVYHR